MRKTKTLPRLAALFSAGALLAGTYFAGVWLHGRFSDFDGFPLWGILLAAFTVACIANRIAAKAFARSHFGISPEEREALLAEHEVACKADPEAALQKFAGMEMVPLSMLGIYFLLVLAMSVAAGLVDALFWWLTSPLALLLLYMPLLRLWERVSRRRLCRDGLVPLQQLPVLHEIAWRAAEASGIKGMVRLEITCECICDVNRIGKTYVVFLGTRLLSVLTREELEQALLMAFTTFSSPRLNREILRRYGLGLLGDAAIRVETFAFDMFFSYADAYVEWEYELYVLALKRYFRSEGYKKIRAGGHTAAGVGMLAKMAFWPYYTFEFIHFVPTPFHQSPEPPDFYEQAICAGFRRACEKRSRAWLDMMERRLPRPGDTAFLFRDERGLLDGGEVGMPTLEYPDLNTPYGADVRVAIADIADIRIRRDVTMGYQQVREREYVEPLKAVEAYEASPEAYTTPELSPVINAYRDLGRFAEAERLCDAIMERERNPFALAHAIYFKGMCMLHRYETEGIDLIYRAIDLNKNYMKDGFEMVEEYCLLCGLSEEYESYRRRAEIQMSAHADNHEDAGVLRATDHLEAETQLGDMLADILAYMEQVAEGGIQQIYLVRKVISEDFFTSAFVVNFEYGLADEEMRRIYSAIFNYLDAYPVDWQFSLFVYDRETERAVRRVEHSLVWEKK